jgi:tRNA1(Val) A37 N6-methylase TrmN6
MLRLVTQSRVDTIADICVGEGSLLLAASARFPAANLVASDIARSSTNRIEKLFPNAAVSCCDVLNPDSFRKKTILGRHKGRVSLALLNPPFSCRGANKCFDPLPETQALKGSKAGIFFLIAAKLVKEGGEVVAVMPASFPSSEKDAAIRAFLQSIGVLTVHHSLGRGTFPTCSATTVLVHFRRGKRTEFIPEELDGELTSFCRMKTTLIRGRVACSRPLKGKGTRRLFLHTTGLLGKAVRREYRSISGPVTWVRGPALLIPRVGKPDPFKITAITTASPTVLSDCLFALLFDHIGEAKRAQKLVRDHWDLIEGEFRGTGAPFITLRNLKRALNKISAIQDSKSDLIPTAIPRMVKLSAIC